MTDEQPILLSGYEASRIGELAEQFGVTLDELDKSTPLQLAIKRILDDGLFIRRLRRQLEKLEKHLATPQSELTPVQLVARKFQVDDELLTDPRISKLCRYKGRLDATVLTLASPEVRKKIGWVRPGPERKERLIARIRSLFGFDDDQERRPETLISSIAETLLFTARLRRSAGALLSNNTKEQTCQR